MARSRGLPSPVRYGVVGLGHIAQAAILPAFGRAARNSRLTALVSSDMRKRRTLAAKYGAEQSYSYDEYEDCLSHVDAVYIALPNSMHADYAIRAARAGVHVLCEKPMALTVDQCQTMIDVCRAHGVKLMIAYRLQLETITCAVYDLVRSGRIGEPRFFNSSFSFSVHEGNIRTNKALGGGSLYDIGVYCINAARHIFRAEPIEVQAMSVIGGGTPARQIDLCTAALLRFDRGRVAAFVTSLDAAGVGSYRVVGTKGDILVKPAYAYRKPLAYELTINGKTTRRRSAKSDQFAAELLHFSDCIRADRQPGPSGLDAMEDVRVVEALGRSARTGRAVSIAG